MGQKADALVEIDKFQGWAESVDTRDLPSGAAHVQTNVCNIVQGELNVRRGYKDVTFES